MPVPRTRRRPCRFMVKLASQSPMTRRAEPVPNSHNVLCLRIVPPERQRQSRHGMASAGAAGGLKSARDLLRLRSGWRRYNRHIETSRAGR
jgi:hypothetical protein